VGNNRLRFLYLSHLSKPSSDRLVYRTIRQRRIRTIVELGIGLCCRARRMIEVAAMSGSADRVAYVGVDPFEARSLTDGPGLPLRMAHRLLANTGARIRLVPGDAFTALARAANDLRGIDLIVVSACQDADSLARAWYYLPRMLHEGSLVLAEENLPSGGTRFRQVSVVEIAGLAADAAPRRAA